MDQTPIRSKSIRIRRRASLVMALITPMLAFEANAQDHDHLKCFKIRDEMTFRSAAVDLDALAAEFGLESCTIKGRAKEFCVPVTKDVTSIDGGSVIAADAEPLTLGRLCYKLRCAASTVAPQVVADQFGTRTISRFKAFELCTPATIVAPTTTTTTMPDSRDDTFDGSMLDPEWSVLHPSLVTISVSGGALHLTPTATGAPDIWFNSGEGPLVYKEVTGDFVVQATLTTRDPAMTANPPPPQYRLAGILARDPSSTPASSNTVHVAIGAGSSGQGTSYEYKSTDDSVSDWAATPTASPSGQVRLRRTGATIDMSWRPDALASWTVIQTFNRPDLPATLQVGPMVYSVEAPASIEALFDDIDFE